jgi:hypothetical protein
MSRLRVLVIAVVAASGGCGGSSSPDDCKVSCAAEGDLCPDGLHCESGMCRADGETGACPGSDSDAPTTAASPLPGVYRSAPIVTLTASEPATIYYTLDGSEPTTSSESGASPLELSDGLGGGATIRFFAVDAAGNAGEAREAVYQVDRLGPAPVADLQLTVDGDSADLSWSNPADDGFEAVVVARVDDVAGTHVVDGTVHEMGDMLPGGGEVVFEGDGESAGESDLAPGGVTYVAWARYANGVHSEPRAVAAPIALPPQTVSVTVDVAGASAVLEGAAPSAFTVAPRFASFADTTAELDVSLVATTPNLLYGVKLVVTSIEGDPGLALANADGTIADGGAHDGEVYRLYGPAALPRGVDRVRRLQISGATGTSVFTIHLAIVRDRVITRLGWDDDNTGGWLFDLGGRKVDLALPAPPLFSGGPTSGGKYQGATQSLDGRYMYVGVRQYPRVLKLDLTTMSVVGGVELEIARPAGSVAHMFANQARTRLYAVVNDGMHNGISTTTTPEQTAARLHRSIPDGVTVYLVEIDADTMRETARVEVASGNVNFRGRRGAISPDDREVAIPAGRLSRANAGVAYSSRIYRVDLSAMDVIDEIDLTGVVSATHVVYTADGARLVTNQNYNVAAPPAVVGVVIDLADGAVSPIPVVDQMVGQASIKQLTPLPDGRVLAGGYWPGLLALDPADLTLAPVTDYTGTARAINHDAATGQLIISHDTTLSMVDLESGDVLMSATIPGAYSHEAPLSVY